MPASAIISLLVTYGPSAISLISTLISKAEASGNVTAAEWTALTAQLSLTAQDHMLAQLKAAGIDPASPNGVALLAASK